MRWFVRALAGIAILWLFFAASPYLALYDLAKAVDRGDVALVAQRVNFRALRLAFARELAEGFLAETDTDGRITPAERQLATGAVATFGEPLLERWTTPQGLIDLMHGKAEEATASEAPSFARMQPRSWSDLLALVSRAQTRGFRTVYFVLPPRAPPEQSFRVQFRLSRFEWKVVNLELPPALRQRLARDIASRLAPESKPR